jgi:Holliday junction resolvase RusA-like endonuclease
MIQFGIKAPAKQVRPYPTTKPDVDKLLRTCLDAITQAGNVWADDSQVIVLTGAKYYETNPITRIEITLDKTFDGMAAR